MAIGKRQSSWQREFDDLMRAMAGAFLFGAPFLYTMEVWWKGDFATPPFMLFVLGISYLLLIVLNLQGGFRRQQATSWRRIFTDSLEALAIAVLAAAASLLLIGVINADTGFEAAMGRIITETLPFSVGVGIANHVLQKQNGENGNGAKNQDDANGEGKKGAAGADDLHEKSDDEESDDTGDPLLHQWHGHAWSGMFADAGATALGAIIIASSIAPTDEIPMIAGALSPPRLLLIVACSLLISYIIVFEADFAGQATRRTQPGPLQNPINETLVSYLISLLISLLMLWLFRLLRTEDPASQWVSYTLILGLPATIGGAAGRLVL